jgi:hypothetical protein
MQKVFLKSSLPGYVRTHLFIPLLYLKNDVISNEVRGEILYDMQSPLSYRIRFLFRPTTYSSPCSIEMTIFFY